MRRIFNSNFAFIILIVLLCVPVVLPYFKSGYFPTHDGEWAVVRLADMFRSLRDLQFPVRFSGVLNFGYGYPLFNFAYPFPYYFGILFYSLFNSFILSVKAMFVLSVFLSGIFMYLASFKLWKNRTAGFVSAVFYIYLPYRMVDLYVRGSIGESLALFLFPLIFYFALRLFDNPFGRVNVFFLSLIIGILVMTHNIMTVLFIPILITFIFARVIQERKSIVLQPFLLSLFLGFGLSAFFWFPALFGRGNILLSIVPIADRNLYFANLSQLLIPSWGYAPPTESGGFSYQLGISQSVIVLIVFFYLLFRFLKTNFLQTPALKYAFTLLLVWVVCLLMLFPFSQVFWKNLPFLQEINYPWTLLSQLGLISSLLGGFLVLQGRFGKYSLITLSLFAVFFVLPYAKPFIYNNYDDNYYLTNEATTTSSNELMPLWVKEHPTQRFENKIEVLEGFAEISDILYSSNKISFSYKANKDSTLRINTIYYPGWKVYLDGRNINEAHENTKGTMEINVPKSGNKVVLLFQETISRQLSNLVSLVSLLTLTLILIKPMLLLKSK